jgi:dTDP-4-dehydrorhamnose 3,5-epimerase
VSRWREVDRAISLADRRGGAAAHAKPGKSMQFHPTALHDVVVIDIEPRGDERGFFARTFCEEEFARAGLPTRWVQHSFSVSAERHTLRGMHFQKPPHAEDKLIRCLTGAIYDVLIDLRPHSPTFRRWAGFELSAANRRSLFAPKGMAHGFLTLEPNTEVGYMMTTPFAPGFDGGVRHDDPAFAVAWPAAPAVIADKDRAWPDFSA